MSVSEDPLKSFVLKLNEKKNEIEALKTKEKALNLNCNFLEQKLRIVNDEIADTRQEIQRLYTQNNEYRSNNAGLRAQIEDENTRKLNLIMTFDSTLDVIQRKTNELHELREEYERIKSQNENFRNNIVST